MAVDWLKSLLDVPRAAPQRERPFSWDRLPAAGKDVFGRDQELARLTGALESPRKTTIVVVGWGGTGKSTLVSHWKTAMAPAYSGLSRGFGWSF